MQKILLLFLAVLCISVPLTGQEQDYQLLSLKIIGQDTIPCAEIQGVEVFSIKIFKNKRKYHRNSRLIRNVKKVYPWARLAGAKLNEYENILSHTDSEHKKRKLMKQLEKEIQEEYGSELKKLTFSQGKILIKLIDRETGNTSYNLVKDFRGGLPAFFYQSFARIFGYNLKTRYEPQGRDRNIEIIVKMIEQGII